MDPSGGTIRSALSRSVVLLLAASLPQRAIAAPDPFAGLAAVKDEKLDELRGGFENSQGLQFSFAIERAVVINGELISATRLVLNDLSPLLRGELPSAEVLTSARTVLQNGLGNTITPAPAAPAASPSTPSTSPASTGAPAATTASAGLQSVPTVPVAPSLSAPTVPSSAPTSTSTVAASSPASTPPASAVTSAPIAGTGAAPATSTATAAASPSVSTQATTAPASPSVSVPAATAPVAATTAAAPAPGALYVQMNAAGQTLVIPNASAIVTAVQNTVNNQIIETRTVIDATLNSLSALRASTFAESIRLQAIEGIRRP